MQACPYNRPGKSAAGRLHALPRLAAKLEGYVHRAHWGFPFFVAFLSAAPAKHIGRHERCIQNRGIGWGIAVVYADQAVDGHLGVECRR